MGSLLLLQLDAKQKEILVQEKDLAPCCRSASKNHPSLNYCWRRLRKYSKNTTRPCDLALRDTNHDLSGLSRFLNAPFSNVM